MPNISLSMILFDCTKPPSGSVLKILESLRPRDFALNSSSLRFRRHFPFHPLQWHDTDDAAVIRELFAAFVAFQWF